MHVPRNGLSDVSPTICRQSGSTLTTVLFLMAALSAMIPVMMQLSENKTREISYNNTLLARDTLATMLKRSLGTAPTFYASLASNLPLKQCIFDDSAYDGVTNDCVQNPNGYPLKLTSGDVLVSGDTNHPVYYDIDGKICTTPGTNICLFGVSSSFKPDCGGPASCNMAVTLNVEVIIATVGHNVNFAPLLVQMSVPVLTLSKVAEVVPPPDPPGLVPMLGPPQIDPPPPPPHPILSRSCPPGAYADQGGGCKPIYL